MGESLAFHVKSIVARRLQAAPDEKPAPQQPLQTSPSSYEIAQLVVYQMKIILTGNEHYNRPLKKAITLEKRTSYFS